MIFKGTEEDDDLIAETDLPDSYTYFYGLVFVDNEHTTKSTKIYAPRKFLRIQ